MFYPRFCAKRKLPQTGGKPRSDRKMPRLNRSYEHPVTTTSRARLNRLPNANIRMGGSTGTLRGMVRQAAINLKVVKRYVRPFYPTPAQITSVIRAFDERKHYCAFDIAENDPVTAIPGYTRLCISRVFFFPNAPVSSDLACIISLANKQLASHRSCINTQLSIREVTFSFSGLGY